MDTLLNTYIGTSHKYKSTIKLGLLIISGFKYLPFTVLITNVTMLSSGMCSLTRTVIIKLIYNTEENYVCIPWTQASFYLSFLAYGMLVRRMRNYALTFNLWSRSWH